MEVAVAAAVAVYRTHACMHGSMNVNCVMIWVFERCL